MSDPGSEVMLEARALLSKVFPEADSEQRVEASHRLFEIASKLNARGLVKEERTLWQVIQTAALYAEPAGLAALCEFLKPSASSYVQQVTLQAIASAARLGPLPAIPELRELRREVAASAERCCRHELLCIASVAAMAISSVDAAQALSLPQVERWTSVFQARPLLLGQLEHALAETTARWPDGTKERGLSESERSIGPRRPRLYIGQEFTHPRTKHVWRVTDIGVHSTVVIDVTQTLEDHGGDRSWLSGPPYAIVQHVWEAFDLGVLEDVVGIEWEDAPRSRRTNLVVCPHCGWRDPESGLAHGGDEGTWDHECQVCKETFVATRIISERVVSRRREDT